MPNPSTPIPEDDDWDDVSGETIINKDTIPWGYAQFLAAKAYGEVKAGHTSRTGSIGEMARRKAHLAVSGLWRYPSGEGHLPGFAELGQSRTMVGGMGVRSVHEIRNGHKGRGGSE